MEKPLNGLRHKIASGRDCYEIESANSGFMDTMAAILKSQFGFQEQGELLDGFDVLYQDFSNGEITLVLGWDVWSGCFIYAQQPEGDATIAAIGDYLDAFLKTL